MYHAAGWFEPTGQQMQSQPLVEVTSSSFAGNQRFDYWADVVTQKFVPLECDSPDRKNFQGDIRHRRIGLIGIADVKASAMSARRTLATIARAPSDDLIAVLHVEGVCRTGQNDSIAMLYSGQGAMVRTDARYFFEFPDQFRQLVLKLPRYLLAEGRITHERGWPLCLASGPARLLKRLALSVLEEPIAYSDDEETGIERAFAELLWSAATSAQGKRAPDRYTEACLFIRRHLANPHLKPGVVASELKMSQRNLARLFARYGTTIERAIWSDRLAAARRDLVDPRFSDESITAIAFSWGFSDSAHFSRTFCRTYGVPPSIYRSSVCGQRSEMSERSKQSDR
jgi:AraC-like DNA-binding protein